MKILFLFLSLISNLLAAPLDNNSPFNHFENDFNETIFQLTTPQDTAKDENISRWIVLMTPRVIEDDSPEINTIQDDEPLFSTNETKNKPYTIFEPDMDPSNPENYSDVQEYNSLKTILASLFNFQPWTWTRSEEVIEKYSPTEPTPPSKVSRAKDELPETLVLPTPPTIESERSSESTSENDIDNRLNDDLKSLDEVEKLAMKLDEKEKMEFILDNDDIDLEFYTQQLELLKSMESTLLKLKSYFDKETETQEKLLDKSWVNSIVIASVGIIYLLLIFAFFSFKSLFDTDKEKEQKNNSVMDNIQNGITEKNAIQHV